MSNLIYDRTKADTDRVAELETKIRKGTATETERMEWSQPMKGATNFADLNRIESATRTLADLLLSYGYRVSVTVKTDWQRTDTPNTAEINRIRANINALQEGFYSLPDWREIVVNNTLDFEQANALEFDLHAIGVWVERMVGAFVYAGEIYGGEEFI